MKYSVRYISKNHPYNPLDYMVKLNRKEMFKARKFLKSVGHIPIVFIGDTEIEVENDDK